VTANGTSLNGGNVNRSLRAALSCAGLPHERFHDLRHLHVALMLEAGDDIAAISKSLGHSTIATTVDTYAHLSRRMSEQSAERMDRILAG
jgi:integrase